MFAVMRRVGFAERLGEERIFLEQPVRQTSTMKAVAYAYALIEARCENCPWNPDAAIANPAPSLSA